MALQSEVNRSTQVSFLSQYERQNARFQRDMEDTHTVIPCLDGDADTFYASVFDGHGGKETAIYISQHLHENLIAAIKLDDLKTTQHRLEYAYYKTDMESKIKDVKTSGSTAVTILIVNENGKRVLYSANAGDARSIFYSDGTTQRLSFDHKATVEEETKRIKELGGFILNKRVLGLLAISRSFGDHACKRYITPTPYINRVELTEQSDFVVLACDGVYDVLSDEDVSTIVRTEVFSGNVEKCAESIVLKAIEMGSTDNITAIVVGLKPPSEWSSYSVC